MHKNLSPPPTGRFIRSRRGQGPCRCSSENPTTRPMTEVPDDSQPDRSRGGRPPKAPADRRTHRLLVRMKVREKTRVRRAAARAGLSVSEHIRRKVLVPAVSPRVSRETRDRLRELGVRLNAFARQANTEGRVPDDARLADLLDELRTILRGLRRDLSEHTAGPTNGAT